MVLDVSQCNRTFQPYSPEAAGTVEVPITASTAQGGIFIADAAPGELLILSLRLGGHGLGLPGPKRDGGKKEGVWGTAAEAAGQSGREAVVAAGMGAFLTSGSTLQDWAWARRVGSTGMLKPLASSRAASSVSCGQSE